MVSPYITVMFCTDHISFVINKHNGIMSSVKYFWFDLLLELDISKLIWKWVWEGGIYIKSQWVIGSLSDVKANERMRKWGLSMFFSPSCQKGSQCYADRCLLSALMCRIQEQRRDCIWTLQTRVHWQKEVIELLSVQVLYIFAHTLHLLLLYESVSWLIH